MKITGELLKSERINLKLSVQEVSSSLKLSVKIINALEAGDLDKLPSKAFIRGFVKSYAQFLKLDVDAVLRQFQEEMGSTTPLPKIPPPMPAAEDEAIKAPRPVPKQTSQNYSVNTSSTLTSPFKDSDNQKKILFMIAAAVLVIVVLVVSNKVVENFNSNPLATISESAESAPAPSNETLPAAEATNVVSADQTQALNQAVSQDTEPNKPDPNAITLENGFEKTSGKPVEILLEAKKDTELFYAKGDATQLESLKLTANQIQVIRSAAGLYLKIVDPASVKLSVNGTNKKISGTGNKEIKLTF